MRKVLKITALISAGLIFVGSIMAAVAAAAGATKTYYWNNGLKVVQNSEMVTYDEAVNAFHGINVDSDIFNVTILTADRYSVAYTCYESDKKPKVEVSNGILTVDTNQRNSTYRHSLLRPNNEMRTLVITVPQGTELKSADIELAMGSAELRDMKLKHMELELAMGNLEIENSQVDSAQIICEMGSVEIDNLVCHTLRTEVSMGRFEAKQLETNGEVDIEAAMGSIKLSGAIGGNVKLEAAMGSIRMNTTIPRAEYSFDLECSMGDITVDRTSYKGHIYDDDNNAQHRISATADMGSIDIQCG